MTAINASIVPRKSSVAGEEPAPSDLITAEIAINTADGKLFTKHTDNTIVELGGSGGASWTIQNNGSLHYRFDGPGFDGTEDDPIIYVQRGQKYFFQSFLGIHPFQLQTSPGVGQSAYTDGVVGSQPITNGGFNWTVQMDAPEELYYQCTVHDEMSGIIRVTGGGGAEVIGDLDDVKGQDNLYEGLTNGYTNTAAMPTSSGYWSVNNTGDGFLFSSDQDPDFSGLSIPDAIKFEVGTDYVHTTTVASVTRFQTTNTHIFDVNDAFPAEWRNGGGSTIPAGSQVRITSISFPAQTLTAYDGQVLTWSDAESTWLPETLSNAPVDSVNGQTGAVSLAVEDINNVTVTSVADEDVLRWNATNTAWENSALATVASTGDYNDLINLPSSGVVSSINTLTGDVVLGLGGLDDVTITAVGNEDVIRWNSTNSAWENSSLATVATTGDYDDLANKPVLVTSINDLTDVDTSTVAPLLGGFLVWDGSSKWEPVKYLRVIGGSFGSGL